MYTDTDRGKHHPERMKSQSQQHRSSCMRTQSQLIPSSQCGKVSQAGCVHSRVCRSVASCPSLSPLVLRQVNGTEVKQLGTEIPSVMCTDAFCLLLLCCSLAFLIHDNRPLDCVLQGWLNRCEVRKTCLLYVCVSVCVCVIVHELQIGVYKGFTSHTPQVFYMFYKD